MNRMLNINNFLEDKLEEISISVEDIALIQEKIKDFFEIIKRYFPEIRGYTFGGSFDRYTSIPNYFDIDIYFIFTRDAIKQLSGKNLLNTLMNILIQLETKDEDEITPYYIKIRQLDQYFHSIPIIFDNLKLDCLAAIEISGHPNTYYIPNGENIEKSNPEIIQTRLQEFNKITNGMGTKLIRLLKLWNFTHGKKIKSFQLELLCYYIFVERNKASKFDSLMRGIEIFMDNGLYYIQSKETVYRKAMLEFIIDDKAINQFKEAKELMLACKWFKLFG